MRLKVANTADFGLTEEVGLVNIGRLKHPERSPLLPLLRVGGNLRIKLSRYAVERHAVAGLDNKLFLQPEPLLEILQLSPVASGKQR